MSKEIKLAIGQINPCVGDFKRNLQLVHRCIEQARQQGANVVVFPEMAVTAYPPEDLLYRPAFLQQVEQQLEHICSYSTGLTVIVGAPVRRQGCLYNMALVYRDGQLQAEYAKQHLPNYRVFDEKRYFTAGDETLLVEIHGVQTAILICEDIWKDEPVRVAAEQGAELVLVLNASPFRVDKAQERLAILRNHAKQQQLPIVYVNLVGGQDELVFDGHSLIVDGTGQLVFQGKPFEEATYVVDVKLEHPAVNRQELHLQSAERQIYQALVAGLRDYVDKNGFNGVMLGLSGGIDSALTLAIAVDAFGSESVEAVMMPFRYTSEMSVSDARKQARQLGVSYHEIPIESIFNSFMAALQDKFTGLETDVTEENIQARTRGVLLMAMSNKLGKMLLATGNKSEMSMGYATLYGDMSGGFAPLKDVYKTMVYRLANYRNQCGDGEIIPQRVITRPPSAELAPDQKDEDSLPPYEILDAILRQFIEEFKSVDDIVANGFDRPTVHRVANLVLVNEYKRRQSAPGIRISRRAFGKDRRYPITSAYRRYLTG